MLDRNLLRHDPERVKTALAAKQTDPTLVDSFLSLDARWRTALAELEGLKGLRNRVSESIGQAKKEGRDAEEAIAQIASIKGRIQELKAETARLETELNGLLAMLPNLPHHTVPMGASEKDNVVIREWGDKREYQFEPQPHWELAVSHKLIDFERGAKVSGSGFIMYTGLGARLERALLNMMLEFHTRQRGYTEIFPPFLVNEASYFGTGQFPKFREEVYACRDDDLFLISTAEVPVTNLYRDETLAMDQLPINFAAYSACFRREAGAAGKDTRGLLRVHQFNKIELVKFVAPETSYDEHEELCGDAEAVLQALGIAYRVTSLCSAELSFSAAKCYDLEVWSPGVGSWLEVSSCSNFEDFQSRRAGLRFRRETGAKPEFVHTLNASGVAMPRLVACVLETFQQADGTICIPQTLRPYLGADRIG